MQAHADILSGDHAGEFNLENFAGIGQPKPLQVSHHNLYENFGMQDGVVGSSGHSSSPFSPPLDNVEWAGTLSSERRRQLADVIVELRGGSYRDEPSPIRSEQDVTDEQVYQYDLGQGMQMDPMQNQMHYYSQQPVELDGEKIRNSLKHVQLSEYQQLDPSG